MIGEVRRAEAEASRLRDEAKRLQERLKRKAGKAGGELPSLGLTRSQSSNVGGSGQLPTRKKAEQRKPPAAVLRAYRSGPVQMGARSRSEAALPVPLVPF